MGTEHLEGRHNPFQLGSFPTVTGAVTANRYDSGSYTVSGLWSPDYC